MADEIDGVTDTENPAIEEPKVNAAQDDAGDKPAEDGADKAKKDAWHVKRINREVAKRHAAERTNAELLAEIASIKSGKAPEGMTQAQLEAEIDKRADLRVSERDFNAKCNAVYQEGAEEYGDFQEAVKTLGTMGVMNRDFLDLVTELDSSHKVLYHLGTNPEEADRIQSLSPAKQALALAKIESELEKGAPADKKEDKKISKAPAPIKPVESKSNKSAVAYASKYYEGMPQAEFEAWDDKQNKRA